ncbi:hypothetical protein Tco_0647652 [Tanacetum coccineum]
MNYEVAPKWYSVALSFYGGVTVASSLNCSHDSIPFMYLGLPVGKSMHFCDGWSDVVNRIRNRLSAWKSKSLSIGGRLTLVNSVLDSIPIYFLSIFKAPTKIINLLESLRRRFFWGFKEDQHGISWDKWDYILASPKFGGLGVGSLLAKNLALLGKWKWRFLTEKDALWRKVVSCFYGSNGGLASSSSSPCRYGVWSDIVKTISKIESIDDSFKHSFSLKISNGTNVSFWKEAWCLDGMRLMDRFPRLFALDSFQDCKISDRWGLVNGNWSGMWSWRIPPRGRALDDLASLILVIGNFYLSKGNDRWVWRRDAFGIFKVSSLSASIQNKVLADSFIDISLGKIRILNYPYLSKILHGVFYCALWSIWKWRNKVVNAPVTSLSEVNNEDIFPFIQRMSKLWIAARCKKLSLDWSRWISSPNSVLGGS